MSQLPDEVSLPFFNDMHIHARQDLAMAVIKHSVAYCDHMLVMPNTLPPILTGEHALEYGRQLAHIADVPVERVIPTIKLVPGQTTLQTIQDAAKAGVKAAKLYPAGRTTNSADGFTSIDNCFPWFEWMEELEMVLCIHGEHPRPSKYVTVMDWEQEFIAQIFPAITERFKRLRIVLEHVSSSDAVDAVKDSSERVAATITAHHLLLTIDDVIGDGIRPDNYCKPIAKEPGDLESLREAVFNPKFFLGSDSAPHTTDRKHSPCGCAGCFTAPFLPELVMHAFDEIAKTWDSANIRWRDVIEEFTSQRAARFYKLPPSSGRTLTMRRGTTQVPDELWINNAFYTPFWANRPLNWVRS